jgi:cell division control protein 45
MLYSSYVASRLGIWKANGKKRLGTLLVTIGLPLDEARNQFSAMNGEVKKNLKANIKQAASDFGLKDIMCHSFYKVR